MAHRNQPQKEKTSIKRPDRFPQEFTLRIGKLTDFYRVVQVLNHELGHGNWTARGRPVRLLERAEMYNNVPFKRERASVPVVFCVPNGAESMQSRLVLELAR